MTRHVTYKYLMEACEEGRLHALDPLKDMSGKNHYSVSIRERRLEGVREIQATINSNQLEEFIKSYIHKRQGG